MARRTRSQVSVQTVTTVALTVLGIGYAAWFFWQTTLALFLSVAALLIACALNRVVEWLDGRGLPRPWGITFVMLAVAGAMVGLGFLFIPTAVTQIQQLVAAWPKLLATAERSDVYRFLDRYLGFGQLIQRLRGPGPAIIGQVVGPAINVVSWIVEGLTAVITVLFIVIFMLATGRPLVWAALAQIRPDRRAMYAEVVVHVYRQLGDYVAGHLFIIVTNAIATTIFLAVIHVPFFLPLGVLSGLASLVPYAGAATAGLLLSVVAWASNGIWTGLGTAIYFLAYQQLEGHVLYPLVYKRFVNVNPLVIVLVVLFMINFGGIPAGVVAVPLAATGQIILRAVLTARRRRLQIPKTKVTSTLLSPERPPDAPRH